MPRATGACIHSIKAGLSLTAGIDWGTNSPNQTPLALTVNAKLSDAALAAVKADVEAGIVQCMSGVANKDDEHWLQAVLRRHPKSLGSLEGHSGWGKTRIVQEFYRRLATESRSRLALITSTTNENQQEARNAGAISA